MAGRFEARETLEASKMAMRNGDFQESIALSLIAIGEQLDGLEDTLARLPE